MIKLMFASVIFVLCLLSIGSCYNRENVPKVVNEIECQIITYGEHVEQQPGSMDGWDQV